MKKSLSIALFIFVLCFVLTAQTVIENPEKPSGGNAGRVKELVELVRIDDVGGEYYFIGNKIPSTEGKPEVIEVPYDLIAVSEEGEKIDHVISSPMID